MTRTVKDSSPDPDTKSIRDVILAELFNTTVEKTAKLFIEPPFWCDYGNNIEFLGEFVSYFLVIVFGAGY